MNKNSKSTSSNSSNSNGNKVAIINEENATAFFRSIHWANGVYCPTCKSFNIYNRGKEGHVYRYSCKDCNSSFSDFTATIFHKTKLLLSEIIYIFFNRDIKSITQISKDLCRSRQTIYRIAVVLDKGVEEFEANFLDSDNMDISDDSINISQNNRNDFSSTTISNIANNADNNINNIMMA